MPTEFHQIDAFASGPFAGNPAAVFVLDAFPADELMQSVAREMNLSETAFVVRQPDGWTLRWFTPSYEVDLCGHATLATAHLLYESGRADADIVFHTKSGPLTVTRTDSGRIRMDFPAEPVAARPRPQGLEEAVGAPVEFFGENRMDALVQVPDAGWLRALDPNINWIADRPWRGLIVTAEGDRDGLDFVSRAFFPGAGIPEDPVTGSAHCALAPFWAHRLEKTSMMAEQASTRGGLVGVHLKDDRVILSGTAVTVIRGELLVDLVR